VLALFPPAAPDREHSGGDEVGPVVEVRHVTARSDDRAEGESWSRASRMVGTTAVEDDGPAGEQGPASSRPGPVSPVTTATRGARDRCRFATFFLSVVTVKTSVDRTVFPVPFICADRRSTAAIDGRDQPMRLSRASESR
jgi:hypothetical protein